MAVSAFPNHTQIPSRLSIRAWQSIRVVSVLAALAVAGLLVGAPETGLFVLWQLVVPLLPALFLVAPGLWRNICPLAASNQAPRVLGMTRALAPPAWLREHGYLVAVGLFVAFVVLRKLGLDDDGPASALLLLGAMAGAFVGGVVLKGKGGWCSSICPLLPVQRIYGQTPFALVANSHCRPCVGCAKSCYDFNPRAAYLADLHDPDRHWSGRRKLFAGAFPGLVVAFFALPEPPAVAGPEMLGRVALALAVSVASFVLLESVLRVGAHRLTTLYGALAFTLFYWYAGPGLADAIAPGDAPDPAGWALRAGAAGLAAVWAVRTWRTERPFREQAAAVPSAAPPARRSLAGHRATHAGDPEVTFVPDDTRVVARPGLSLLEIAEADGRAIEAGCRMGVCGADPVAVRDGMAHLSPIGDDERSTLDRLGLAENTRMACCARVSGPVRVSLTPDRPRRLRTSQIRDFPYDRDVRRVVVVGNGIAGVTAADHVRRRHPACAIDLVAAEPHHLYNRMGISRLIHGRSAMQGLALNPDDWYGERSITTWLNTRARRIDRGAREVELGTGERLPYDRLVLATGARSSVPPIDGFGIAGTAVLRTADDALALRAFAQRHSARRAIVAGGGLLGLEAAYALHELGLRTTVLERSDRLLRRQLDVRAAALLRRYLEGLGLEVVVDAEAAAVAGRGRVREVRLHDDRVLSADVVLVAAGIAPDAALAADAGLATNRGVIVDDRMRTSDELVLAAGDVAEWRGQVPGLWPVAVAQAEVAADTATGGTRTYAGIVPATILKVVGIELASIGRVEAVADDDEVIVLEDAAAVRYRKLVVTEGRIAGAILLGHGQELPAVRTAVARGLDVTPELDALRSGRWDGLARLGGDQLPQPT